MAIKRLVFVILCMLPFASAQELQSFLAQLQDHPALLALDARLDALEAQRRATLSPFNLDANVGYSRFFSDDVGSDAATLQLPESASQLNLSATFRPLVYGDIATSIKQLELDIARAQHSRRSLMTQLESQAIEAAANAILAAEAVTLAEQAVDLAVEALSVNERRFERGAASERDLREARQALREAEAAAIEALSSQRLAKLSLSTLVGEADLDSVPVLTIPTGTPGELVSAEFDLAGAQLNLEAAIRTLYPIAQASYTVNLDDNSSVTAGLESRTLQPSLSYGFQDPARSSPENLINSSFQIGVSVSYSPALLDAVRIVEENIKAAEATIDATRAQVLLQEQAALSAHAEAERELKAAQQHLNDREISLGETETRLELGLSTPLERQQAWFNRFQAELAVQRAALSRLQRTLDLYKLYSLAPSEVLP